jgi:hypothetical protein
VKDGRTLLPIAMVSLDRRSIYDRYLTSVALMRLGDA